MSLHGVGGSSSFHPQEEPLRPEEGVTNEFGTLSMTPYKDGGTQAAVNKEILEHSPDGSFTRQRNIYRDLKNPNHQLEGNGSFPTNLGHNTGQSGPTPPTALYKANANGHVTGYAVYNDRGEIMYTNDGSDVKSISEKMKKAPSPKELAESTPPTPEWHRLGNQIRHQLRGVDRDRYNSMLKGPILTADREHFPLPLVNRPPRPSGPEPDDLEDDPIRIPPRSSGPEPNDLENSLSSRPRPNGPRPLPVDSLDNEYGSLSTRPIELPE